MADRGVGSSLRRLCASTGASGRPWSRSRRFGRRSRSLARSAARTAGPAEDGAGPADGDRRCPAGAGRDAGTGRPAPDARQEGAGPTREAEARPGEGRPGREAEGQSAGPRGAAATRSLPGAAGRVRRVPVRRLGRPRPARARGLRAAARCDGRRSRALRRAATRAEPRESSRCWGLLALVLFVPSAATARSVRPDTTCSPGPANCPVGIRAT